MQNFRHICIYIRFIVSSRLADRLGFGNRSSAFDIEQSFFLRSWGRSTSRHRSPMRSSLLLWLISSLSNRCYESKIVKSNHHPVKGRWQRKVPIFFSLKLVMKTPTFGSHAPDLDKTDVTAESGFSALLESWPKTCANIRDCSLVTNSQFLTPWLIKLKRHHWQK